MTSEHPRTRATAPTIPRPEPRTAFYLDKGVGRNNPLPPLPGPLGVKHEMLLNRLGFWDKVGIVGGLAIMSLGVAALLSPMFSR